MKPLRGGGGLSERNAKGNWPRARDSGKRHGEKKSSSRGESFFWRRHVHCGDETIGSVLAKIGAEKNVLAGTKTQNTKETKTISITGAKKAEVKVCRYQRMGTKKEKIQCAAS